MNHEEKSKGKSFKAFINPLQLLDVDEPWASVHQEPPDHKVLLEFMCTPGIPCDLQSLVDRYRQISQEKARLIAAPAEERILEKLIWPLRHAKACYMVGNYLGTISLCGMVAEMVANLTFEISELKINNRTMSPKDQADVFGRPFEEVTQYRKVHILHAINLIGESLANDLLLINKIRNKYLHLWSKDHASLPVDAVKTYNAAVSIVVATIGQKIEDGMIQLNPALIKYLENEGVVEEGNQNQE